MAAQETDILKQLAQIRALVRHRLLLYGACAVLSGGCLSFLTVITLDWLLRLPPSLRLLGSALFVVGFGLATLRLIVQPLQTKLSLAQIAGKLERHFKGLDDRLSSVVSFLTQKTDADPAMVRQVISNTRRVVAGLSLPSALTSRPLRRQASLLLIGIVVLGAVAMVSPDWIAVGVRRYAQPFDEIEWPRYVDIQPLTDFAKIAVGESTTVGMEVVRGGGPELRGLLHLVDPSGNETVLAMQRNEGDRYQCTIDSLATDLTYWFEAGDATTRQAPGRIQVVRRPSVTRACVTIHPPPYARTTQTAVFDLGASQPPPADQSPKRQRGVFAPQPRAVLGSRVSLAIETSRPIRIGGRSPASAWLAIEDGRNIPLKVSDRRPDLLVADLTIERSTKFRIHLVDRDGFAGAAARTFEIQAYPDEAPVVDFIEPFADLDITARGSVPLTVRARDDFGLKDLRLTARAVDPWADSDRTTDVDLSLLHHAKIETNEAGVVARVEYLWNIESLNLVAPTALLLQVQATDNFVHGEIAGQTARSQPIRIKVISDADFENQLRDDLFLIERRLRHALTDQRLVNDRTDALARAAAFMPPGADDGKRSQCRVGQTPPNSCSPAALGWGERPARCTPRGGGATSWSPSDSAAALGLADTQANLARRVKRLSREADRLLQRIVRSGLHTSVFLPVAELPRRLSEVATGPMSDSADHLEAAGGPIAPQPNPQRRIDLTGATNDQRQIVASLQSVIEQIAGWTDFQNLLTRTGDLIDRQQRLKEQTLALARDTIARRAEELPRDVQTNLQRLNRTQRQLADELAGMIEKLRSIAEPGAANAGEPGAHGAHHDPNSIDRLVRAAGAAEVVQRMSEAAEAIAQNRLAGAGIDQSAALQGLSKMRAALRRQRVRRLVELAKRLERAEQTAGYLLAQQEDLLVATREAVAGATGGLPASVFLRFADRQQRLRRNTDEFSRDLHASPETTAAGDLLREAAQAMRRAAEALARTRRSQPASSEAPDAQEAAAERLRQTVAWLEKRARQSAHTASQRIMAQTRAQLEELHLEQTKINQGTAEVRDILAARGRLDRVRARRLAALARMQLAADESTERIRETLSATIVYNRVLLAVAADMRVSYDSLQARRLEKPLASTQQRIARRIDQLVRALQQAESLPPSDEFIQSSRSHSGGSAGSQRSPLPTAAELLMLKTMQADVLADTAILGTSRSPDEEPSEDELIAAEELGLRQRELRAMTEEVIDNAAKNH